MLVRHRGLIIPGLSPKVSNADLSKFGDCLNLLVGGVDVKLNTSSAFWYNVWSPKRSTGPHQVHPDAYFRTKPPVGMEADRTAQGGCRSAHNAALRRSFWNRESLHTASSWPSAV